MAETVSVKLDRTYTPPTTLRTLYAGSTYTLDEGIAFEVVEGQGAGHYAAPEGVEATDAAAREAARSGVDLKKVSATGSGGKVTAQDVKEAE